jgi:hypothetical protein
MVERQFVELVTVVRFHDSGPFMAGLVRPDGVALMRQQPATTYGDVAKRLMCGTANP